MFKSPTVMSLVGSVVYSAMLMLASESVVLAKSSTMKKKYIRPASYNTGSSENRSTARSTDSEFKKLGSSGSPKSYGVSGRAGYFVGGVMSYGIDGYKSMGDGLQLGALYTHGQYQDKHADKDYPDSQVTGTVDATLAGIYGRKFFSETFSATLGGVYRAAKIDVESQGLDQSDYRASVEGSSLGLMAQIGNRWKWDNGFTLGCDWFGYTIPLAKLSQKGSFSADGFTIEDKDLWEDLSRKIALDPIIQALMLDVGYEF